MVGHQLVQGIEIDVGEQRTDHRTLRRALHRRPSLQTLQDIGLQPASDQIEHAAIADLALDPRHERFMWNRVEVGSQIRIHHMGVSVLDQPIDFPQRVMAPASRTEAVAPLREPVLEDRFDDEANGLLDDAVLDRGHSHIELH